MAAGERPPRYRRFRRQICAGSVDDELRPRLPERVITLPQQAGPRSCIGARLSLVTAHRVLHTLLRDFEIVVDNDTAPARPLIFGLKREGGFRAALRRR